MTVIPSANPRASGVRGLASRLALAMCVLALAGCAGMASFREGKSLMAQGRLEDGLQKLEEAVALEPGNVEYRIHLANSKSAVINQLLDEADKTFRGGDIGNAEKVLRRAQNLDPRSDRIQQGLDSLARERQHRQQVKEAEEISKGASAEALDLALGKLRSVLAVNPQQRDALALKARIDEELTRRAQATPALGEGFRRPVTIDLREAPLRSAFEVISKVSGLNFYYDRDVRPDLKASISAKNTSVEDIIRIVLVTNQLEMMVLNENSVLVFPNTPQKLKDYQSLAVRTFFLTNADVKAVSNSIKTLLKTKDMVIDERLGIIIMRDTPEAIRVAERIVALQDLNDPEVVLDVEILEIKRSRLMELGIQWPSQLTLSPVLIDEAPLRLTDLQRIRPSTLEVGVGNGFINARKEDQDGRILANPRIRVRNKDKAKIQIGDRVPVITTTSTSTGFASESVSYVDVGLKLEVEPNVYLDNEVAIKINLEVSSLVREITSAGGSLSYQIGTRGANTVLRLKDGETQVLAGLISDEDRSTANKLPGLGDLPVAGRLFGSQKDDTQRSEILLSITPRVVRSIRRPDAVESLFDSGTEASVGAPSLRLRTLDVPKESAQAADAKEGAVVAPPQVSRPALPVTGAPRAAAVTGEREVPVVSPPAGAVSAPPAPPPATSASAPAAAQKAAGASALSMQAPSQVRAGEQFSVVVHVSSQSPLEGLPVLIAYDPSLLQVASAREGDFFRQGGARTAFNHRVDPAAGRVFVSAVRRGEGGGAKGVNGSASVVVLAFKALKAGTQPKVEVLSATPEPAGVAMTLPAAHSIRVEP